MSGIVFWKTRALTVMKDFYTRRVGMSVWLEQEDCVILAHGNMLVGFCSREDVDAGGLITVFYPDRDLVDAAYEGFAADADAPPRANEKYEIYHFFAKDPEGRDLEFQSFDRPLRPHFDGIELLATRRSVRRYRDTTVDPRVLDEIFESCRHAPSARNSQPCSFIVIRNSDTLRRLSVLRGESSAPIASASVAVAIVSDPAESPRAVDDGCIAAYHLLLSAWAHGLGTCWMGGMDQDEAKSILGIPTDRRLITITPLGYPDERPSVRTRRPVRTAERN